MDIEHFKKWVIHEVSITPECIGMPDKSPTLDGISGETFKLVFPTFKNEEIRKEKLMLCVTKDLHQIGLYALAKNVNISFWWNSMSPSHIDLTVKITNINS